MLLGIKSLNTFSNIWNCICVKQNAFNFHVVFKLKYLRLNCFLYIACFILTTMLPVKLIIFQSLREKQGPLLVLLWSLWRWRSKNHQSNVSISPSLLKLLDGCLDPSCLSPNQCHAKWSGHTVDLIWFARIETNKMWALPMDIICWLMCSFWMVVLVFISYLAL